MSARPIKLYSVRYTAHGERLSKPVGYKCRLIPKRQAMKLRNRLAQSGVDASISPLVVNATPEQKAYLRARYRA